MVDCMPADFLNLSFSCVVAFQMRMLCNLDRYTYWERRENGIEWAKENHKQNSNGKFESFSLVFPFFSSAEVKQECLSLSKVYRWCGFTMCGIFIDLFLQKLPFQCSAVTLIVVELFEENWKIKKSNRKCVAWRWQNENDITGVSSLLNYFMLEVCAGRIAKRRTDFSGRVFICAVSFSLCFFMPCGFNFSHMHSNSIFSKGFGIGFGVYAQLGKNILEEWKRMESVPETHVKEN